MPAPSRWREKRWKYVAVIAPEAFVAAAVADLGYLGYAFATVHDRRADRTWGFQRLVPLAVGFQVGEGPDGASGYRGFGERIRIDLAGGQLALAGRGFRASVRLGAAAPWEASWPIPPCGHDRTVKAMGFPVDGELVLRGQAIPLAGHGLRDWTRGDLGRETDWRWAAGVGRADGRLVAWNLRAGLKDPDGVENAVWVDGTPAFAGPATIEPGRPWRATSADLDLRFEPEGERREDLNLGVLASRYVQPFGRFTGTFRGVTLEGYGVVEDHWARW